MHAPGLINESLNSFTDLILSGGVLVINDDMIENRFGSFTYLNFIHLHINSSEIDPI